MENESRGNSAKTLGELSQKYQQLNKMKIQADRDLEHARDQLDGLKKKAKEDYGTDDLEELRAKLEEMKRKNEEDRASYQMSLEKIETELEEVEKKYGSA